MKKCFQRLLGCGVLFIVGCAENGSTRSSNWMSSSNPPVATGAPGGGAEGYYWYDSGNTPTNRSSGNYQQGGNYQQSGPRSSDPGRSPNPANTSGPR